MIRFAVSECALYSGCLLGNLLDYFHLIRLGRGHQALLRGLVSSTVAAYVPSCVLSACGMLTEADGEGKTE